MNYEQNCKIEVQFSTYERVRQLKERGDTFDSVIKRLLELYDAIQHDDLYTGLVVE